MNRHSMVGCTLTKAATDMMLTSAHEGVWPSGFARISCRQQIDTNSGLDARCMISRLHPPDVNVLSLTTVATPHHGSAFADYMFDRIGRESRFSS